MAFAVLISPSPQATRSSSTCESSLILLILISSLPPASAEGFLFFLLFSCLFRKPSDDYADGDEDVQPLLFGIPAGRPIGRDVHVRSSFPGGFTASPVPKREKHGVLPKKF